VGLRGRQAQYHLDSAWAHVQLGEDARAVIHLLETEWSRDTHRDRRVSDAARWLYVVAAAAPPVLQLEEFVTELHRRDWKTCVIATPTAASWIDLGSLSVATGCLTRVHASLPGQQESLPRAEAVVAAPITFNSINKWAAGISDTVALGMLNEMLGVEVPSSRCRVSSLPCRSTLPIEKASSG
jgi:hypothetical protein